MANTYVEVCAYVLGMHLHSMPTANDCGTLHASLRMPQCRMALLRSACRMPHLVGWRLPNKTGDYERHTDVRYGSVVARHYECSCE